MLTTSAVRLHVGNAVKMIDVIGQIPGDSGDGEYDPIILVIKYIVVVEAVSYER